MQILIFICSCLHSIFSAQSIQLNQIMPQSTNSSQFSLQLLHSRSQWTVQKVSSSVNLQASQNSGVNFVSQLESNLWLVLFDGLNDFFLLAFVQSFGWNDSDVFFFVKNFAVGDEGFDDFFEIAQSTIQWMNYLPASTRVSKKLLVIWWYCCGANDEITSLCWFLLIAEFLRNSLMSDYWEITLWRWVTSLRTTSRASFLEAAVNKDPAYLPATLSAMAGGLWPSINEEATLYWFNSLTGEEVSRDEWKFLEHHWLFMIKYKWIMINKTHSQLRKLILD